MSSPNDIAIAVLDAHAIQPNWRRDRSQIHLLIVEAVTAAQNESRTVVGKLVTDKMQLGNELVLALHPQFNKDELGMDAPDEFRDHADEIASALSSPNFDGATLLLGKYMGSVTVDQARHILAYLSTEARAAQSGDPQ